LLGIPTSSWASRIIKIAKSELAGISISEHPSVAQWRETFLTQRLSDDKVEQTHLDNSFDVTCREWKARYGLPYTYCGCPLPGGVLSERLSSLSKHIFGKKEKGYEDLIPIDDSSREGTHRSAHNAVRVQAGNVHMKSMLQKAQRRHEREIVHQDVPVDEEEKRDRQRREAHWSSQQDVMSRELLVPVPTSAPSRRSRACIADPYIVGPDSCQSMATADTESSFSSKVQEYVL
jgi:hypothetical protein